MNFNDYFKDIMQKNDQQNDENAYGLLKKTKHHKSQLNLHE